MYLNCFHPPEKLVPTRLQHQNTQHWAKLMWPNLLYYYCRYASPFGDSFNNKSNFKLLLLSYALCFARYQFLTQQRRSQFKAVFCAIHVECWDADLEASQRTLVHNMNFHSLVCCFPPDRCFVALCVYLELRPRSHSQFYPTRRVARVHTASTASGSSGTLRPDQVFAVDANGTRRVGAAVWMLEWTRRQRMSADWPMSIHCNAANRVRRNHDTVG